MSKLMRFTSLLLASSLAFAVASSLPAPWLTGAAAEEKEEVTVDVYGFDTPEQEMLHDAITSYILSKHSQATNIQAVQQPQLFSTGLNGVTHSQANVQAQRQLGSTALSGVSGEVDAVGTELDAVLRGSDTKKKIVWRVLRHDTGQKYEGEWFSQEHGGYSRLFPYPIFGMRCRGNFCDDKKPLYTMPLKRPLHNTVAYWTKFTSDKDAVYNGAEETVHCPRGMFVIQMQCRGWTCQDIRLGCGRLRWEFKASYKLTNYEQTHGGKDNLNPTFSDEGTGVGLCPDGEYMDGIGCEGWWCDNVRLYCTTIMIRVEKSY